MRRRRREKWWGRRRRRRNRSRSRSRRIIRRWSSAHSLYLPCLGVLSVCELHEGHAGRAAVQAGHDMDGVVHQRGHLRQARVLEELDDVVLGGGSERQAVDRG